MAKNTQSNTFIFKNIPFDLDEKLHCIEVECHLRSDGERKIYASSAIIHATNSRSSEMMYGGQCLGTIFARTPLSDNSLFRELYELWNKYHLNDMHPGTPEQERCLAEGNMLDAPYDERILYLKNHNLYEVELDGKPYKYGHSWIYEAIPDADLDRIYDLLN